MCTAAVSARICQIELESVSVTRVDDLNEATARIEAALYSAGRPLRIEDLIRASGTESKIKTISILQGLIKKTRSTFKAIEVVVLPDGSYVLQLKPEYGSIVKRYASKPFLSKATLRTLSYIASEEPVSSKQLVDVRGSGVYSHLKELRRLDYITFQSSGRLKIYSTTEKLRRYFGVSGDAADLKKILFSKVKKTGGAGTVRGGSTGAGGTHGTAGVDS